MDNNFYTLAQMYGSLVKFPSFQGISPSAILDGIDFFADVDESVITGIADLAIIAEYSAGSLICRHGKFNEWLYVILKGEVRAIIPTPDDPRYEIYRIGRGNFFGEDILFSSEPRESSIFAVDDVTVIALPEKAIREVVSHSQRIKGLLDQAYIDRKLRNDLRSVPIFTSLDESLFNAVLEKVELVNREEGDEIFHQGDPGDAFYLIRDGEVKVYRDVKGSETLISILAEGQFFGEMSLLLDDTRNATVICSKNCDLVKISSADFLDIIQKDPRMYSELQEVVKARKKNRDDVLKNPQLAVITRKQLDLNRDINHHLDILSQCTLDTDNGSALLATLPGSRYPYVYPRDSACASRFLYKLTTSPLKSGEIAFRLLGEISRFILHCQREDGYWGQRYGIDNSDKGIYRQEDNVAHGVIILCRYLLAAKNRQVEIQDVERMIDAIDRGSAYARKNYYRNEIHLFYSTTSIHESAIEEGYSIWVNYAYLLMLRLIREVGMAYGVIDRFEEEMELKDGFEAIIENVFTMSERFVRRLKPDGETDLRPDITLMSPFFFGTGMDTPFFKDTPFFQNTIKFIEQTLWDPDLGMLQRYLPFIEDPHTHIHAGNGPWLQYTSMLAQYYYFTGNIEKGDKIISIIDEYASREGYLCEHLTTAERFYEFKRLEWLPGNDFDKEFALDILVPGITYDLIVEELNHMKNAYDEIDRKIMTQKDDKYLTFALPLMWSHAEYAMALMMRVESELATLQDSK